MNLAYNLEKAFARLCAIILHNSNNPTAGPPLRGGAPTHHGREPSQPDQAPRTPRRPLRPFLADDLARVGTRCGTESLPIGQAFQGLVGLEEAPGQAESSLRFIGPPSGQDLAAGLDPARRSGSRAYSGSVGATRPARLKRPSCPSVAGTAGEPLGALAWGHPLPRRAKSLPPEVWWDLLGRLFEAVADSDGVELDEAPLVHQ